MKKSLLATVAAVSLITGAGFASAEGAKDQPGMKGGAAGSGAVQSEPAMKQGADIKAGAPNRGAAETTGAATESQSEMKAEPKAGADTKMDKKAGDTKTKPSTTGQATDQKAPPAARSSTNDKAAPDARSATDTKAAPAGKSATDTKAGAGTNAAAADTKSSNGASVNLTTEQKTRIRTSVIQSSSAPKVSRSQINFNISIGTVVPRSVRFVAVPSTLVEYYPAYRGHSYFIVDDEIIIVDSRTMKIIAVIEV